jgi:hypothetical protein
VWVFKDVDGLEAEAICARLKITRRMGYEACIALAGLCATP